MGNFGIRISKEGLDVNTTPTSSNIKNFQLLSTEGSLVEKEKSTTPSDTNMFFAYSLSPNDDNYSNFGAIKTVTIANGGSGYTAYDLISIIGADSNAKVYISAVNGGGTAISLFINTGGSGYSVANGVSTTGGTGSGFEINITDVTLTNDYRAHPENAGYNTKIYTIFENEMP